MPTIMPVHSFDIDIAKEHGVQIAVIVNNLDFWLHKNAANKVNMFYHEERFWTYNSIGAFLKIFPYFSRDQVRRYLTRMEKDNIIVTGNFNSSMYDRTKWYSFTDAFCEKWKSNLRYPNIHFANLPNPNGKSAEPIQDSNIDSNIDEKDLVKQEVLLVAEKWNNLCSKTIPKIHTHKLSGARRNAVTARLKEFGAEKVHYLIEYVHKNSFLNGVNERRWIATFDWVFKQANFQKIIEGNYERKGSKQLPKQGKLISEGTARRVFEEVTGRGI